MKVISGKYKGLILPKYNEEVTRPTINRVKESLFGMIQNKVKNSTVLDLFAGTGSLGIECLSNGADFVYFNELNKLQYNELSKWLEKTSNYKLTKLDYHELLNNIEVKFDIIFLDPPYKTNYAIKSLELIFKNDLLKEDGIIVVETDQEFKMDEYNVFKFKKYGNKFIYIIKA